MNVPFLLSGVLALLTVAGAAQAPRAAEPPSRSGRVHVDVVEHTNAAPIQDAVAVLSALPPGSGRVRSTTFADGSAWFEDVPPGRYTVSATADEHVPAPGATPVMAPPGLTLTVEPGQVSNIRLTLARAPAIQGVVLSPDGQPVGGASVSLLTTQPAVSVPFLKGSGDPITDADGRFRIISLIPGSFRIRVSLDRSTPPRFNYIYWPGTTLSSEAQWLDLTYGDEPVITIVAAAVPTVRLSGRVVDLGGHPVARADITLGAETIKEVSVQSRADGTFTVPGLRSGAYHLVASVPDGSVKGRVSQAAVGQVGIGADDLADLTLTVRPTAAITGRFLFNGEERADPGRAQLSASPDGADAQARRALVSSGGWHADGTFELYGLIGRHVIRPTGLPSGWRTEGILLEDGTDLLEAPFDFASAMTHRNVRVLLTDQAAAINVTVTGDRSAGPPLVAVAFPEDGSGWQGTSGLVQVGRVSSAGTVALRGLAPGKVYLVALFRMASPAAGVVAFSPVDSALLGALTSGAARVVVPAAGELSVTLDSATALQMR